MTVFEVSVEVIGLAALVLLFSHTSEAFFSVIEDVAPSSWWVIELGYVLSNVVGKHTDL